MVLFETEGRCGSFRFVSVDDDSTKSSRGEEETCVEYEMLRTLYLCGILHRFLYNDMLLFVRKCGCVVIAPFSTVTFGLTLSFFGIFSYKITSVVEDIEEREEREEEEGDQNANLLECLTSCWRKNEQKEKLGNLKKELNIVRTI